MTIVSTFGFSQRYVGYFVPVGDPSKPSAELQQILAPLAGLSLAELETVSAYLSDLQYAAAQRESAKLADFARMLAERRKREEEFSDAQARVQIGENQK